MAEPPSRHCQPPQAYGGPLLHHPHPAGTNEGRLWMDSGHQTRALGTNCYHFLLSCIFVWGRVGVLPCIPLCLSRSHLHLTMSLWIFIFTVFISFLHWSNHVHFTFLSLHSHCVAVSHHFSLHLLLFLRGKIDNAYCHLATSHYSDFSIVYTLIII